MMRGMMIKRELIDIRRMRVNVIEEIISLVLCQKLWLATRLGKLSAAQVKIAATQRTKVYRF